MENETCKTCKFFEGMDDKIGRCRRYPPNPFPMTHEQVISYWPSVQLKQWCGEWKIDLVFFEGIKQ